MVGGARSHGVDANLSERAARYRGPECEADVADCGQRNRGPGTSALERVVGLR